MMAQPRLHMIGNAHLDPVWLWRWPEGCAEAIGTCWAAIELLAEYPGMIFTRGEAIVYRWIEELDPPLFARIQALVREKRWVIVNGWWLQPDCNLPSGEAFIRQALYGKRYFRDRFGVDVTVGFNVDSFGHAGTLPMLLRHTGSTHYVFMRPMEHEHSLPASLFDWIAPDGSAITTFRLAVSYNTSRNRSLAEKIEAEQDLAAAQGTPLMCFYGVGNHGGGPTRANLDDITRLRAEGRDVVESDPYRYFAEVDSLPRPSVSDELQMHAIGCYAAVSALKALNRKAEGALAQAEAAATLALLHAGAPYPGADLRMLWETLLFNQFHDILCGTSVPSATIDAIQSFGGVIQGAEQLLNRSIRHLARTIAPAPDSADAAFLVFNLTGTGQQRIVEYEPWTGWEPASYQLLDETGADVPYQDVQSENYTAPGLHRILFSRSIPAFGYRLFRFKASGGATPISSSLHAEPYCLESAGWRLDIDRDTGAIAGLFDKAVNRAVFSGPAHLALVVDDPSDTWSHDLDRFGLDGERFRCERVDVLEQGPLRAAVRVRARAGLSTVTSTYLLYDDPALPLEIRVTVDWRGGLQLLRLAYPVAIPEPAFRYEVPYGSLQRPADGREHPGQRWVLADGDGYGIALVNDAKYSYAALDNVLYVTALRSPVYAHHDPTKLDPAGDYPLTDQGPQSFRIRLCAGPNVTATTAHRCADDLLNAPIVTPHVARTGKGAHSGNLLDVQTATSSVVWLKATEDGSESVLRLLEHEGISDTVILPESGDRHTISPYGILSLRRNRQGRWQRSDGLEREAPEIGTKP